MCLGIPSKIISIKDLSATIDVYGAQRNISIMLLEDDVKIGDYVLVHAGFAIQKLPEDYAKETLKLFDDYLGINVQTAPSDNTDAFQLKKAKSRKKRAKSYNH